MVYCSTVLLFLSIKNIVSGITLNGLNSDTCKEQRTCQFNSKWDRNLVDNVKTANCFCSEDCATYGDCCSDSIYNTTRPNTDYVCTKEGLPETYFLKVKCPYDADVELKRLCESPTSDDPFLYIPATSLLSNTTYRNIYCGVCNNENVAILKLWLPVLACTAYDGSSVFLDVTILRSHVKYNLKTKLWEYDVMDSVMREYKNGVRCQTEFSIPPKSVIGKVKHCKDHLGWCHAAWNDELISSKCHSYTAYVYNSEGGAFKNFYCAKCNYVNTEELTCHMPNTIYSTDDVYVRKLLKDLYARGDHITCTVTNYYSGNRISSLCGPGLMPFSVGSETTCVEIPEFPFAGIGFNAIALPREVCSLEFIIPVTSKNHLSRRHCRSGYVYDPFIGQCRTLSLEYREGSASIAIANPVEHEIKDDFSATDMKDEVQVIVAQERTSKTSN